MKPYYQDDRATVLHGDCLALMAEMPDASFDAVVTDPPYGLGFMGKTWDDLPPGVEWAQECLRVLKPGGHLLAFGGSRTWHRLACAVEDAGFEIRDSIAWLYGSGFPKSLDVSKAIDKAAGAEREVVGSKLDLPGYHLHGHSGGEAFGHGLAVTTPETRLAASQITAPATPDAQTWQGWGTALKPAFEPVVMARKPLVGNVAANVLEFGTGALNVDGCRIGSEQRRNGGMSSLGVMHDDNWTPGAVQSVVTGRWPANVLLDDTQAAELDRQSGTTASSDRPRRNTAEAHNRTASMGKSSKDWTTGGHNDTGGASRFFYVAKAPQSERPKVGGIAHPTVKPLALMQWLIRLVTPPGGHILDPFAGSGTTVEAALRERVRVTAIEREADYLPLILQRIERHEDAPDEPPTLFDDMEASA